MEELTEFKPDPAAKNSWKNLGNQQSERKKASAVGTQDHRTNQKATKSDTNINKQNKLNPLPDPVPPAAR